MLPSMSIPTAKAKQVRELLIHDEKGETAGFNISLLDMMPIGIIILGQNGAITYLNQAMEEISGIKREEAIGQVFIEVFYPPASYPQGPRGSKVWEAFLDKKELREVEVRRIGKDGAPQILLVNTYLINADDGSGPRVLATIVDITRTKDLEGAVIKAEKLAILGQIAAGAAHEIRNPLTSIRGFIQLLRSQLAGTSKEHYVDILLEEIDRINSIVNDFLNLAKPGEPKRQLFSLPELFREIHSLVESEAMLNDIQIEKTFPLVLPDVNIDKEQIKQVLINIIKNSFEAMPGGGKIKISIDHGEVDRTIGISIVDTGIGMDQETIARVFQTFFTTKKSGTGLGMAVSKEIIRNHGGEIFIDSTVGLGTTVTVKLPISNTQDS